MKRALTALAYTGLTLGALTLAMTAQAQDDAEEAVTAAEAMVDDIDREGERCISTNSLRSTHAVDDRSMLFYMRGGVIYLNVLSHNCPGLKRQNRISYKVMAGRLCSVDVITVLESFGGGLSPGISCGLGQFYGISEDEARFLRYGERSEIQEEPEAVDLPDGDEASED
jgi:hypothetical protein